MTDFESPIEVQGEPEIMVARRAFPVAQAELGGAAERLVSVSAAVVWHDTALHPETGATALVPRTGDFADLVGEVVAVTRRLAKGDRRVYAYVIGHADIGEADLSLYRRAFLALGVLANEEIRCTVEVVA